MPESTNDELREQLANLFDSGVSMKSRAGGTAEAEHYYKIVSVDEAIKKVHQHIEQAVREARIDELAAADIAMDASGINETEEWEEYYDSRFAQLTAQQREEKNDAT